MKQILTIEQSARLIEFGVDAKLASKDRYDFDANGNEYREYRFTLSDLLSILPKKVSDRQRIYELEMWVDHYSDDWCVKYSHEEDSFQSAEELCDAIYAEICWLKNEDNKNIVWL